MAWLLVDVARIRWTIALEQQQQGLQRRFSASIEGPPGAVGLTAQRRWVSNCAMPLGALYLAVTPCLILHALRLTRSASHLTAHT